MICINDNVLEDMARQLAETFLCPTCFPSDDLRDRKWDGRWHLTVDHDPVVVKLITFFDCAKGHMVRAVQSITDKPRSSVRARRTKS